jgi:ubiquitin fusion degradation protein 1
VFILWRLLVNFARKKRKMFGMGFGFHPPSNGPFIEQFRCLSFSFLQNKQDKENGDKIILPISAFQKLAGMRVQYPMQFELRNENVVPIRRTHVGVLEFTAPEGQMFVPYWIMQNLLLEENELITVRNVSLSLATFVKFRPLSVDFLEISNPKAVLESTLRNFSCLTKDDQICLQYNGKNYFIEIVELKPVTPENAVSIVEADVNVDFEPPVGYVDPKERAMDAKTSSASSISATSSSTVNGTKPTGGEGKTLGSSGSSSSASSMAELAKAREERRKQLEQQKAAYVPFAGSGRRIDDKAVKQPGTSSPTAGPVSANEISSITQGKWKSKTKGAAFHGEGRTLQQ